MLYIPHDFVFVLPIVRSFICLIIAPSIILWIFCELIICIVIKVRFLYWLLYCYYFPVLASVIKPNAYYIGYWYI